MKKRTFEINGFTFRVCKVCGKKLELNAENFHRDANESYGFKYTCKHCSTQPKELIPEGYSKCTGPLHHGALLPIENFSPRNDTAKGVQSHCKECQKAKYYARSTHKRRKELFVVPGVVRQCSGKFCGGKIYPDSPKYLTKNGNSYYCKFCKSQYRKQPRQKEQARDAANRRYHRLKHDPEFILIKNTRARISKTLKRLSLKDTYKGKEGSTLQTITGCSAPELKAYIESHRDFKRPITWENYGTVWHLDHIRAIATFDLSNPVEFFTCFHYKNLRPCLVDENLRKSKSKTDLEEYPLFSHEELQEIYKKASLVSLDKLAG